MSDYIAGTRIEALDFPPAVSASNNTQIDNFASANYSPGNLEVSVTFIAPTSGRVWVIIGGGIGNSSGADRIFLSPEIRLNNSAGSVIVSPSAPAHGFGSFKGAASFHYGSRRTLVTGLIPGQTYFARVMQACSTSDTGPSTADIACRDIAVVPAT